MSDSSTSGAAPVRQSDIFRFWTPLAATWLMMSCEGPYVAALIARLDEPKFNLAAYGVAFALAMIFESPIIMMLTASTALVKDAQSYLLLRNFTFLLNVAITVCMLVGIVPALFLPFAQQVLGLPEEVARMTHAAMIFLLPWPAAIGYRRFNHGILIRSGRTRAVAWGTVVRLSSMTATGIVLFHFRSVPGATVGACCLSMGVVCESIASRIMAHRAIRELVQQPPVPGAQPVTWTGVSRFYFPLALTSIVHLATNPVVTFFVGGSRSAIESLAVLPVVNSLVFAFRSFAVAWQEVVVALLARNPRNIVPLRRYGLVLGGLSTLGLSTVAFTPLGEIWFADVAALTPDLIAFALTPLSIQVVLPALGTWLIWQHARLVDARRTSYITMGMIVELTTIALVMLVAIWKLDWIGAVAASAALVAGRTLACLFLQRSPPLRSGAPSPSHRR